MIRLRIKMRAAATSTVLLNSPLNCLISVTYTLFLLLATIIGNFSVSDADLVLSRHKDVYSTLAQSSSSNNLITEPTRNNVHNQRNNMALANLFSSPTTAPFSRQSVTKTGANVTLSASDFIVRQPQETSLNPRFVHNGSVSDTHLDLSTRDFFQQKTIDKMSPFPLAESGSKKVQFPPSVKRSLSPPLSSFHKRRKRNTGNNNAATSMGMSGQQQREYMDHPFSLWMNDSRELDRNWFLDQLLIRALANPEEWTELRQSLDKVDSDIRALLAFEKGRNHGVYNDTVQGAQSHDASTEKRFSFVYDQHDTTADAKVPVTRGNSGLHALPPAKPAGALHGSSRWKFTYHRVRDLNAAGKPTLRAIAAVVSREQQTFANERKNDTGKNASESSSLVEELPSGINMSSNASSSSSSSITDTGGYNRNNGNSTLNRLQNDTRHRAILKSHNSESGYYSDDASVLERRTNATVPEPTFLTGLENERIVSQGPIKHITQGIKWDVNLDDPLVRRGGAALPSSSLEGKLRQPGQELEVPASSSSQHQHGQHIETKQREKFELHRHHHGSKYSFKHNNNLPCTKHNHHKFCSHRHRQNHKGEDFKSK